MTKKIYLETFKKYPGSLCFPLLKKQNYICVSFQIYHILNVQQQSAQPKARVALPKLLGTSQISLF